MDKYILLAKNQGGNTFWYDPDNPFVGDERHEDIRRDIAHLLQTHALVLNPKKVGTLLLETQLPIGDCIYHPLHPRAEIFYAHRLDTSRQPRYSKFVRTISTKPVYQLVLTLNYWQGKIIINRAQYGKLPFAEPVDVLLQTVRISSRYWGRIGSFWLTHALNPNQIMYDPNSVTHITPAEWDFEKLRRPTPSRILSAV